ncbi:MAG: hypothetical protein ACK4K8_07925 [Pannonibacter sp.]
MDWFLFGLKWLLLATTISPVVLGVGWVIYEGAVLPRFVPRAEIEAMADEVMRRHPEDPEEWAFMEEESAWYRSHTVEQGKWHRVRKVIRRRLLAGDWPPAA